MVIYIFKSVFTRGRVDGESMSEKQSKGEIL